MGPLLAIALIALQEDYTNTAHIHIYADLDRLTSKADQHSQKGQWRDVVEIYAEAIETAPDALIPLEGHRAVSVFDYCMARLADAPEAARDAYRLRFDGMRQDGEGKDHAMIAVAAPERRFQALPYMFWSEFNQGYMKKPHIERFITHDIYISPLDMSGEEPSTRGVWFEKGETKQIGQAKYTFVDFDRQMGSELVRVAARMRVEIGGRTVPVRPVLEMNMKSGIPNSIPDYLPGGGSVQIASVDPNTGRVALEVPGMPRAQAGTILAVEVSTKPLINLVWLGAIVMLASAFMSVARRVLDLKRAAPAPA